MGKFVLWRFLGPEQRRRSLPIPIKVLSLSPHGTHNNNYILYSIILRITVTFEKWVDKRV